MGQWRLQNAQLSISDMTGNVLGHNWRVTFKLKYTPTTFGRYQELPRLEWKESIKLLDRGKGEFWEFQADQYARHPGSLTFFMWRNRYNVAYQFVRDSSGQHDIRLYAANGEKIPSKTFGKASSASEKTKIVIDYLKKHGGILEATVHDKPSIGLNSANVHKERLLTFDCGLRGMGRRFVVYQYLNVDKGQPRTRWTSACKQGVFCLNLNTQGLRRVGPSHDVTKTSTVRTAGGEVV